MSATTERGERDVDVVVVGAGFAGLYLVHRLHESGFTTRAFEAGTDVGGTWYWNRYPGARCDVESLHYSYFFDDTLVNEWEWTEKFATQPEILRYINWVADRLELRPAFSFSTRVDEAVYDENTSRWLVRTDTGETVSARFFISAAGALSASSMPTFPGQGDYRGRIVHTGAWPDAIDLTGQRVAVIGTGSSGIQCIPEIAKTAGHVTVFQRTPNFTLPARNRPLYQDEIIESRRRFNEIRATTRASPTAMPRIRGHQRADEVSPDRQREMFELEWKRGGVGLLALFNDLSADLSANDIAAEFVREKIRIIVDDTATAEVLTPKGYPIGAKRIALDTNYYATFNLPHVDLVDTLSEPLVGFTPSGIATEAGECQFDTVILATGFDGMTGPLTRMNIRGRSGLGLADAWRDGPRNYLGLAVAGFPNFFTITGPGSPSVLVNVVRAIEQHVDWIVDCLLALRALDVDEIEADLAAQDEWVGVVNDIAQETLYVKANSWYLGSNIEGKPRVFLPYAGGLVAYRAACDAVAADGYRGFRLHRFPVSTGQPTDAIGAQNA